MVLLISNAKLDQIIRSVTDHFQGKMYGTYKMSFSSSTSNLQILSIYYAP